MKAWKKGSETGFGKCSSNVGVCYKTGGGTTQNFEKAAEQGDSGALVQLGIEYDECGIATQDFAKAFEYYKKA